MGHDTPELGDAGQGDPPAAVGAYGDLDRSTRASVLGDAGSVSVDEEVGIDRDHACLRSQSCMRSRSATSRSSGSPPGAVTQRIRARRRFFASPSSSWRRSPASTSARNGLRSSAARFLARINNSSGSSMVVFIQGTVHPYLRFNNAPAHGRESSSESAREMVSEKRRATDALAVERLAPRRRLHGQ